MFVIEHTAADFHSKLASVAASRLDDRTLTWINPVEIFTHSVGLAWKGPRNVSATSPKGVTCMTSRQSALRPLPSLRRGAFALIALVGLVIVAFDAEAVPAFNRQTGQNCIACHAGGQFPELTPYGRMFKLTGYTIGERVLPLSVMGVASFASVRDTTKTDDKTVDFQKNGTPLFATGSLFIAGKISENVGAFAQITYDNYAAQSVGADGVSLGKFQGHSHADNMDFRYADRLIDGNKDLIFGVSLNNNPSISDPWNSAAAWMQYVPNASPTSHRFVDGTAPYPAFGSGGNIAGVNLYAYWNRKVYAELGTYQTAKRAFSFMTAGIDNASRTKLKEGSNPYWRFALTHDWGPHNLMVGTSGMVAHIFDGGSDISDPNNVSRVKNVGFDTQYQYLLDPHTITFQAAYMRTTQNYSANARAGASPYFASDGVTPVAAFNPSDKMNVFRAKMSYVYNAKYGGSLSFFNRAGTTNTLNQTSGFDSNGQITSTDPQATGITSARVGGNLSGNPATRGSTYETFWMPVQYVRVGAQYTNYNKFNGTATNYDGFGRNAKDNNTVFFYVWAAY